MIMTGDEWDSVHQKQAKEFAGKFSSFVNGMGRTDKLAVYPHCKHLCTSSTPCASCQRDCED